MIALDSNSLSHWESFADWGTWLVIIGVAGEGVELVIKFFEPCLKKKQRCRHFFHKADPWINAIGGIFWIMVVWGLWMEFKGSHIAKRILDKDNADLHAQASNTDSNNLVLAAKILELAHQYDLSTNALAEANSRLKAIRPIKERLIENLNALDGRIVPSLQTNTAVNFRGTFSSYQYNSLEFLSHEPGADKYITFKPDNGGLSLGAKGGVVYHIDIQVKDALIKP